MWQRRLFLLASYGNLLVHSRSSFLQVKSEHVDNDDGVAPAKETDSLLSKANQPDYAAIPVQKRRVESDMVRNDSDTDRCVRWMKRLDYILLYVLFVAFASFCKNLSICTSNYSAMFMFLEMFF